MHNQHKIIFRSISSKNTGKNSRSYGKRLLFCYFIVFYKGGETIMFRVKKIHCKFDIHDRKSGEVRLIYDRSLDIVLYFDSLAS